MKQERKTNRNSNNRSRRRGSSHAVKQALIEQLTNMPDPLPSIRYLAQEFNVSRGCMAKVLEELTLLGYVHQVDNQLHRTRFQSQQKSSAGLSVPLSAYAARLMELGPQLSSEAIQAHNYGGPSWDMLPLHAWKELCAKNMHHTDITETQGLMRLRVAYADYLRKTRGIFCNPDQVFVFNARESRMPLLSSLFIDPGDLVAVENPGFPTARNTFATYGAKLLPIPVDAKGLQLEHLFSCQQKIKMIHLTPSHQEPTGSTLSISRRRKLISWAGRNRSILLEDDYDSEYRYVGRQLPTLFSLDTSDSVIYMACFWKVLSPLSQLGFLVVPLSLVDTVARAKTLLEPTLPRMDQEVLADFITDGQLYKTLRKARKFYQMRREALIKALRASFRPSPAFAQESAGMDLIVQIKSSLSDEAVVEAAHTCGLTIFSSAPYYLDDHTDGQYIIPFSHINQETIHDSIEKFAARIHKV